MFRTLETLKNAREPQKYSTAQKKYSTAQMRFAYLTRELVIKNQSKLSCQAQTKSLHIAKQKLLFLCFYSTNLNLFQLTRQSKNLKCLSILKDWSSLFNIVRNLVS